ncbi:MAG TPA: hypothetical protein IAC24_02010 [Candidatus Onthousia faecigallinarum]|nr:hypothetical protein [Candidatus Onthousia faecigallinarum]
MSKIICGELTFNNIKYKFDFRDNILVLLPDELQEYTKWHFEHIGAREKFDYVNIDGTTNNGWYICFIHVKFSYLGRGILQAFIPGYVICKANGISPLPICDNIEKLRFYGTCLDKFYYPKRIIETSDFLHSDDIKFEVNKNKLKTEDFIVNKDKFCFGVYWKAPYSSNINVVLDVASFLEINFNNCKNINEIVEYYLNVKKFFSFINNRKYVKFDKIVAYKNEQINYGFKEHDDIRNTEIEFEFFFVDPEDKFDLNNSLNTIHIEDLDNKFSKLYKIITDKDFLTEYYPLSTQDNNYIDNEKYINVSSAFESEFDKLYPKFKSTFSAEYSEVKKSILKFIANKKNRTNKKIKLSTDKNELTSMKKVIKECEYFSKIIKKIDGSLQEKIVYSYKEYNDIIGSKKKELMKNYELVKASPGILADKFVKRRNDISHGNGTEQFTSFEIISYELMRMSIYCITLERIKMSKEKMKNFIDKLF